MGDTVNARPTKRFFIESFTRDLPLEDAILDLVDNSIDAYILTRKIDVSPTLLKTAPKEVIPTEASSDPLVSLIISGDLFEISDRCGGISVERARKEVFRFGRAASFSSALGVYGIGLKRAVFKVGKDITIESRTETEGFIVYINVNNWIEEEDNWEFPMTVIGAAPSPQEAGTKITIKDLNPDIILRINDGTLLKRVSDAIASTYSLFLQRFLSLTLNQKPILPIGLPIAASTDAMPAHKTKPFENVNLELFAGLAERKSGEWNIERAGWYVLCNGRVVVSADKSELTGWGLYGPQFVSKYRGFIGIAFFFSHDPALLPWTTTKRGLNLESGIYIATRQEMASIARPVLTFLNNMYPSEAPEEIVERKIADRLESMNTNVLAEQPQGSFRSVLVPKKRRTTVSVQFKAEKSDIDRVKKKLNRPDWAAGAVGKYALDYYIKVECPE